MVARPLQGREGPGVGNHQAIQRAEIAPRQQRRTLRVRSCVQKKGICWRENISWAASGQGGNEVEGVQVFVGHHREAESPHQACTARQKNPPQHMQVKNLQQKNGRKNGHILGNKSPHWGKKMLFWHPWTIVRPPTHYKKTCFRLF